MLQQPKSPNPEVFADARCLAAAGADRETVLFFLREKGFDNIDSIKAARTLYNLPMPEAKDLIDQSETWSDRFQFDMEFRDEAIRALRDLAASKDSSLPRIEFADPED